MPETSVPPRGQPVKPWAILLAAGQGHRLAAATGGLAKQFLHWQGMPLYWHAAKAMSRSAAVAGIVFVFPPADYDAHAENLRALYAAGDLGLPCLTAVGGALRQDSVRHGLAALPADVSHVLIHDAARPFVSPALIRKICASLESGVPGAIPALPVTDTIKTVSHDLVTGTLPRHTLRAVQTPQGFRLELLLQAHSHAEKQKLNVTDDASLLEELGCEVHVVEGEAANVKITNPEDMDLLRPPHALPRPCTGMGYDVHRYAPGGRPMRLGGVLIPAGPEVAAHSDGDVLLHALTDAILGCAGLGDIGQHFSDKDPRFDNISSALLLDEALDMVRKKGVQLCHADLTLIAQTPRLAPHREEIRKNIARLLALPADCVNLKASTEEGLGFTGRAEGIKAYAVVTAWAGARAAFAPPSFLQRDI
ncbi:MULTISPECIES: 2-C-methyl-D-erythritol 4-phosphate cytidylyltransferase [Desulfovibrio]|uniref:Bifunctional enzyme IspD/IspF n=1 Tax=Desulfovibrio desulfuricans TaxID=876 RepID=A0AA94HU15_DESDE|nr:MULTISPECIES: 2-C-methyl-D-erythritol 4-phosphate cytidylyltransferase [Desulfovibrio]SFW61823.1 2-C-methyl-D-erythritol 2,4-cyclodiphosphate synthase [Desulfovibrio desulfuricans]SPD37050.1 2-C-methyl-D-erythritol 2,4-cyclodiphosphate synthase/2-C-methyl-D-erythritol 4-phosphate cytidylyltransferase [Desulfovibrio sp. G11]